MVKESAWVYLRKSRDKAEAADPDILNKHRREMLRLAAANGDDRPQVFEEMGSGERIHRRPAFSKLLEMIEALPRDHGGRLYTTEVSRATRGSLKDQARVEEALTRASVLHITRGGSFNLRVANDRLMWRLQASLASHELGVYKERVEAARIEMTLAGKLRTGRPPFGYWWDKNTETAQPDPDKFPVLQRLCIDAFTHSTYELEEMYGIPQATILNALRNPFIAGWPAKRWFPHNGERDWVGSSCLAPSDQWLWPQQPGSYPAACTLEEWHAIQAALDRRRDERAKRDTDDGWCKDVVRFVGAEEMRPRLGVWKYPGKRVLTYELQVPGRGRWYIARDLVHSAAEAAILEALADRDGFLRALAEFAAGPQAPLPTADLPREIKALEDRLDALGEQEEEAAAAGDLEEVGSLKRRRDRLKKELAEKRGQMRAASPIAQVSGPFIRSFMRTVESRAAEGWSRLTATEKRAAALVVLERVLVIVEPQAEDTRPIKRGRPPWRREVVEVRRRRLGG